MSITHTIESKTNFEITLRTRLSRDIDTSEQAAMRKNDTAYTVRDFASFMSLILVLQKRIERMAHNYGSIGCGTTSATITIAGAQIDVTNALLETYDWHVACKKEISTSGKSRRLPRELYRANPAHRGNHPGEVWSEFKHRVAQILGEQA